jgi:hypothetical protein
MNRTPLILTIVGIGFAALYFWDVSASNKQTSSMLKIFYASEIHGRLSYVFSSQAKERFRVKGNDQTFMLKSYMMPEYGNWAFGDIAEVGDSVSKPAYADRITLIKPSSKRYVFLIHVHE